LKIVVAAVAVDLAAADLGFGFNSHWNSDY